MLLVAATVLTLRVAVEEALQRSPRTRLATAETAVAQARLSAARAAWLPRVDATATRTRSDNPVFVFGSLLEQGRFGQEHFDPAFLNDPPALRNDRLALNVRWAIFDQLRRLNTTRQAKNAVAQSERADDEIRQRLRSEVMRRYFGVALATERRNVASEAARAAESAAAAIRDKFQQGLVVQSDMLAAEVQVAEFRQQVIESEADLAIARAALATALERPIDEAIVVETGDTTKAFPSVDLQTALARGIEARGELMAAQTGVQSAELQLHSARGALLPRLDLFGSAGASGRTFRERDSDQTVAVIVSFDVFDGTKLARIAESRAAVEAARAGHDAVRDQVTMEIVTAFHRYESARQRAAVADKSAEQASSAAAIVRDRYENGLTTITEHLRAQAALLAARLSVLAARYDAILGYAELLRATGGLHDVDSFT